jgi:hypothetical protein
MPYPFVVMRLAHFPPAASFVTTAPTTLSGYLAFKNNTLGEPSI